MRRRRRYRIEILAHREDRIFAPQRDDDLQPPVDIPFAPIDKYPAISNLQTCWSFFFTSFFFFFFFEIFAFELPAEAGTERDLEVFPAVHESGGLACNAKPFR